MWKAESAEVRAKYYAKSVALKDQLIRAQPNYRYQPRRSADIKRRLRVTSADGNQMVVAPEQQEILNQLYPGITSIRVDPITSSTSIFQSSHVSKTKGPVTITNWAPQNALFSFQTAPIPAQQQVVLFGKSLPTIDCDAALIPAGTSSVNVAEQQDDDEEDNMINDTSTRENSINTIPTGISDIDNFNAAMYGM